MWMSGLLCMVAAMLVPARGVLLDMTHTYDDNSLYWPNGQAAFELTILALGRTEKGYWYQGDEMKSGTHMGTHMDAPNHFYEDKWAIHDIPIERLVALPAVMIDIRQRAADAPNSNVTLDDIRNHEAVYGEIDRGAVVFQCSGWSDKYPNKTAVFGNDRNDTTDFHFPAFGNDAVQWLIEERGAVGIAVDTPSNDYGKSETYPNHVTAASHNVYGLENVKDTCIIPPAGATVTVLPSKIRDASGAPVRIVASWGTSTSSGISHKYQVPRQICYLMTLTIAAFFHFNK